ncbi:MAG: hypothetical protein PHN89_01695, partial [Candidatus Pacebacteria bacterium]|nr:hypothetical protein [Candidatus Paceibacterota bacterium]
WKEKGETPLECLERFRATRPELVKERMTYAGRLDPLAEGVLIALVGEECKKKEKYLGLDKEYEVDVLMGIETDTYDILGKVTNYQGLTLIKDDENFDELVKIFVGKRTQSYPPYSSKTVGGKPLFALAKSGELDDIEIPTKEIEIYSIKLLEKYKISVGNFLAKISDDIARVKGDFRQKEILKLWQKTLSKLFGQNFPVIKIAVACSSGTYMRSLAHEIGKKTGTGALALNIVRTKVGNYCIEK